MDADRFDSLTRSLTVPGSRRRVLALALSGALASLLTREDAEAHNEREKCNKINDTDKRQRCVEQARKHKKKHKKKSERCGPATCSSGTFCCDDARGVCCATGSECCNVGPGTGSCCPSPGRCAQPIGNDAAPYQCCPPERQWFTSVGLVRCCPTGTRSLGTGITADDGPCCLEAKYCSTSLTGGTCCPDVAPVCVNPATGQCCTAARACGTSCCNAGETCVGGQCCPSGRSICSGVCCPAGQTCSVDNNRCEDVTRCPREFCTNRGLGCCPPNNFTNTAYCIPSNCSCANTLVGYTC